MHPSIRWIGGDVPRGRERACDAGRGRAPLSRRDVVRSLLVFVALGGLLPRVAAGASATAVAAGDLHTCAVTSRGALQCWGSNGSGELGDGTRTTRYLPVTVAGLSSGVVAVAAGGYHTCAVTNGGALQCWGSNGSGELGDGTWTSRSLPVMVSGLTSGVVAVAAGASHTCAVTNGGAVLCWGAYNNTPATVGGLSGTVAITAGRRHTCALMSGGVLRCWGDNQYGQLGDGTTTNRSTPAAVSGLSSGVVAVAAGNDHTCAVTSAGSVQCWGSNQYGQLGDGTLTTRLTPITPSGLSGGVFAIGAGGQHTCAVKSDGALRCWGLNSSGQVGDGTTTDRRTQAAVSGLNSGMVTVVGGHDHTCATTGAGAILCWGLDFFGSLGDGKAAEYQLTPVNVVGFGDLPSSFGKVAPFDGAVGTRSSMTLGWTAVPGAMYQVCVDPRDTDVCSVAWVSTGDVPSLVVANLPTGTYRWQVRATSATSAVADADGGAWWSFTVASSTAPLDMSAAGAPNGSWVFAEGALGLQPGFNTYYPIANENSGPVHVRAWFIREGGTTTFWERTIPAHTRFTLDLSAVVNGAPGSYAAVFQSVPFTLDGIPAGLQVYVSRTMYWGGSGSVLFGAGHEAVGTFVPAGESLSTTWYFAEGTRVTTPGGVFDTFVLVFNPYSTDSLVTLNFIGDAGAGVIATVRQTVAAGGRWTLSAADIAPLNSKNFSIRVTSSNGVGIVAERSMYWGTHWSAGHTAMGSSSVAADWYLAEGTAMNHFDTYYLLLNPNDFVATVDVTYQLSPVNGVPQVPVVKTYSLPTNSRTTIFLGNELAGIHPGVAAAFHARNGAPILVERSMYWGTGWTEGSSAMATAAPATEWHLPEGSTVSGFETYLLLSNPAVNDVAVAVTTFSVTGEQQTNEIYVPAQSRVTVYMNNTGAGPVWSTIQGKAFSIRCTVIGTVPIVAEQAVYWGRVNVAGEYWRGGDATMGHPVIR